MKSFKVFIIVCVLVSTLGSLPGTSITPNEAHAAGLPGLPVMFGAYASAHLGGDSGTIDELIEMDNWLVNNGASGMTFAGNFIGITFNPVVNVPREMSAAWDNGFIPFVNLQPSETWDGSYYDPNCREGSDIANGLCDAKLTVWAETFRDWAGTDKFAFIAPLPEMNVPSSWYYSDGPTYIQAFLRIRQIFENVGVPESAVQWVFAPNGWHDPAFPWTAFENYYPGDAYVDIISFSAYNYGGCPTNTPWRTWDTFEIAIEPYLVRMRSMAPSKPIFLAQTGTVGVPDDPYNIQENKTNWVYDTFDKLADYPAVRGIIYFNKTKSEGLTNCEPADYRIYYVDSSVGEAGFLQIMQDNRFGKWDTSSTNWKNIAFADTNSVFSDVQSSHPFSGAPNQWYYNQVYSLYNAGITGGYPDGTYRPGNTVTRAEMAVFLLKAMNPGITVPEVDPTFSDTESHWAKNWIEALKDESITSGYPDGTYRPNNPVTRAEMAVFLLKSINGPDYIAPDVDLTFTDTEGHWAANWIEALKTAGITGGYPDGTYRPNNYVTRAEMAVFLVNGFGLP